MDRNIRETVLVVGEGKYIDIVTENQMDVVKRQIYQVMIGRNKLTEFYNQNVEIRFNKFNDNNIFSMLYFSENSNKPSKFNVSDEFLLRLSMYLNNREEIEEYYVGYQNIENNKFDCGDFVYFIKGWEKGTKIIPKEINTKLTEGEVICIYNKNTNSNYHLAIYIGKGLFISKYGKLPMVISSFQQLKNFYNTNAVFKVEKE